jgi:hypothetical protein
MQRVYGSARWDRAAAACLTIHIVARHLSDWGACGECDVAKRSLGASSARPRKRSPVRSRGRALSGHKDTLRTWSPSSQSRRSSG